MTRTITRRHGLALGAGATLGLAAAARAETPEHEDPWPSIAALTFPGRALADGGAVVAVDAPYRAEDAALVPLTLRVLAGRPVRALTLVIDENPSPIAARIDIAAGADVRRIATNVRIDAYTNLHAVAETEDGSLHAAKRFIKAAGGCSAPALDRTASAVPDGTMRWRQFAPGPDGLPEALLMIRHPNFSGMQMDQLTHLYIPARFVRTVRVWQGADPLLSIECGISIAQNPEFRFSYRPNGAKTFRAEAVDSTGRAFAHEWPAQLAS